MYNSENKIDTILVGSGYMALEYAKVLDALNIKYEVIGRGENSAKSFKDNIGHTVQIGGHKKWLKRKDIKFPPSAIVAVNIEQLAFVTIDLLNSGFNNIFFGF